MARYRLDELCEFITDGTHQTPEYCEEGGVIFLSSKDVTERRINWDGVKYIPESLHQKLYKRLSPKLNDILLAKNGTTGVAAIVDRDEVFDVYVSLAVLRPLESVYPKYLLYAINSPVAKRQFNTGLKGIGVPNLHLGVIKETVVNVVPRDEQEKICEILDKVASMIDIRRVELSALDNLIKARFVEMFGDTIINPLRWEKVVLSTVCDVRDGTHDSPEYQNKGYPLLTSKNVTSGKIDLAGCNYISQEDYDKINERSKVDKGDIIMPMIGTVGRPVIVDKEPLFAIKNVALIKFYKDTKIHNVYVKTLLESDYFDITVRNKIRGGTQKFIALGDIRKLEVLLPPFSEQVKFATFVHQIDKSKVAREYIAA